jgi:hypothetical protein
MYRIGRELMEGEVAGPVVHIHAVAKKIEIKSVKN